MFKYWLVSGGIDDAQRCRQNDKAPDLPLAGRVKYAASNWPRATARIPARTISAMNAAV